MFIAFKDLNVLHDLKHMLKIEFEMKDLSLKKIILGMNITRNRGKDILILSPCGYVKKVIELYNIINLKFLNILIGAHSKLRSTINVFSFNEFHT